MVPDIHNIIAVEEKVRFILYSCIIKAAIL